LGTAQHTETGGAKVTVTVSRLIDPLRDSGAALLPGMRAIGVPVIISNAGPAIYDSSATGDFSMLASSGPVTPVFAPHGVCMTPLMDFDNYITPGESRTGCVAFSVGSHAKIVAVRFSPHGQPQGRLTWSAGG
jgi:hypothetical protein